MGSSRVRRKVAFGCDHAGLVLKNAAVNCLAQMGFEVVDFGTDSDSSCDYPDFAGAVAEAVSKGEAGWGLLICGTGVGMAMVANKFPGVRAAVCNEEFTARYARLHNDANVLTLGGRVVGEDLALSIIKLFFSSDFEGDEKEGERHARRLAKIGQIERSVMEGERKVP